MRRLTVLAVIVAVFALPLTAQAAHCVNESKKPGAGNGMIVLINGTDGSVTASGHGGYADLWLDFEGDGEGDVLLESDIMVGKNHSYFDKDGNWTGPEDPWVNPGAINKAISKGLTAHGMSLASA